ncbi:ParB/Srx family N-terminal domain-containing protein [Vibrio campbellii]
MINVTDITVRLDQLILDPNNYRLFGQTEGQFVEDVDAESLQGATLAKLEKQRLGELKDSIRNHGFLEMERIVVRRLNCNNGEDKYLVVEGNRRTAALKSLEPEAEGDLKSKLTNLNVILIEGDAEQIKTYSATLMGIRHVSGPKKWDGFQSAKLINDLYEEGKSFTVIGDILGITNREAGRRYRGYQAFQQMRLDADFKDDVEPRHYGLLLEFLSPSREGRTWLKWNDAKFLFEDKDRLKVVYKAITKDSSGSLEIRNPSDARKFVSLLSTQYRTDLEQGASIHDMPDPEDLKDSGKLKRIKKFVSFVERNSFNDEEVICLEELGKALKDKLGEE